MKDLKITLLIDGEKKDFNVDFIPLKKLDSILEIVEEMSGENSYFDTVNCLRKFILILFEGQFTKEDLDEGMDLREFMSTSNALIDSILDSFKKN